MLSANKTFEATSRMTKLKFIVQEEGILGLISEFHRMIFQKLHNKILDRYYGFDEPDTIATIVNAKTLTFNGANGDDAHSYDAAPFTVIHWFISAVQITVSDYSFIDVGSGRGRVIAAMERVPFQNVTGIEYSLELHEDAKANVFDPTHQKHKRCGTLELICGDAVDYNVPDTPCIFFMYNPFGGDTVQRFLEMLERSYQANPRPIYIGYYNPEYQAVFDGFANIVPEKLNFLNQMKLNWLSPHRLKIYKIGAN